MENIKIEYTNEEKELINATILKGCTDFEKLQVWHTANKYGLDLMQKGQVWVNSLGGQKNIIVGRDGQLTIAHRQGLKSLVTTCEYQPEDIEHRHPISATCVVERFDGGHFEATAVFTDYNTNQALWKTKPSEMIGKVAESKVLRRAFDMSGFYSSEELDEAKAEAVNIQESSVEAAEKADAGKGNTLFIPRKNRVPTELPAIDYVPSDMKNVRITDVQIEDEKPKVEATINGNTAQITVEVPKAESGADDTVSGANPDNVKDFEAFEKRVWGMFGMKVSEDQRKGVLETPGDYESKKNLLKEKIVEQARKEGRI